MSSSAVLYLTPLNYPGKFTPSDLFAGMSVPACYLPGAPDYRPSFSVRRSHCRLHRWRFFFRGAVLTAGFFSFIYFSPKSACPAFGAR